ncbi:MAG: anhydro-N-acetylmuramic acid kinase [Micavibrio aeruginosavorus]|uniref:Anhydro-N-acetylmuramic acid kinase n=1 Tax=Micavibrio aeruginosavorus TaxID=349221 RepID=A0A2W5FME6_9BACT|nr:MAG: anhydro-N-acetylmuramic acid kinase [Micavibrio aeruginosavorus]
MNDHQNPRVYKGVYKAIGLMSGTSLDGVDVALLETDGKSIVKPGATHYVPYPPELKDEVRACFGKTVPDDYTKTAEEKITLLQAQAVKEFLRNEELQPEDIDVIGFHGQTVTHKPKEGFTWQLGAGAILAHETGINVVDQFRINDVREGGEGAPLIPLYHQALARQKSNLFPVVFLNIGGVSNVTWIGESEDDILAFDTGPGNALMDDFMKQNFEQSYDFAGEKAKTGTADEALLRKWMTSDYLERSPPKSLDRGFLPAKGKKINADMNVWDISGVWHLSPEDAMATLSAFTAETIAASRDHFPALAKAWYVCGGGRHNEFLMTLLSAKMDVSVRSINELGYDGDSIEAEGFAYLAVRHLLDLPLSLPTTTGVKTPCKGGTLHKA